jgi:hypothetical protein
MKEFKIRASGSGKIMSGNIGLTETQESKLVKLTEKEKLTDLQAKEKTELEYKKANPILPQGAKTYVEIWLKEQLYARRQEISSKYCEKGNIVEDDSLDFIGKMLSLGIVMKNEIEFDNDYCTGTPDAILNDFIIDAKNPWDCFTFPLFETECPNDDYFFQAQCYMWLKKMQSYKLIYVLSNTPEHLIKKEFYYFAKANGYSLDDVDAWNKIHDYHTYDNVDDKLKIKIFNIKRDDNVVKAIEERVLMCREYIKELLIKIK